MSRSTASRTLTRSSLSLSAWAPSRCWSRSPASLNAPHRTSSPRSAPTCRVFATDKHLASWAGQCPGNHQSAAKQRSGRTRNGSKWLNEALKQAALAATRRKNTYLQALYQRLRPRIGHGRAIGAVKHSILTTIWRMLSTGETYRDLGGDYFARRDPQRATRRLVAQLERLGHTVTLQAAAR